MKRIIHTTTGETIWRGTEYLVDGKPGTVELPLALLTDVTAPTPEYDASTQRLSSVPDYIDGDTYVRGAFEVVSLTTEEIAANTAADARKTWANAAAFLGEFSIAELAGISLSTDPTVAALRLLLAAWPADVWSDDPRIQTGMDALVSSGVINAERRAEVLPPV